MMLVYIRCMIRTNTYLSNPSVFHLKELAGQTGISVSEHVRRAVDQYLERERKKSLSIEKAARRQLPCLAAKD